MMMRRLKFWCKYPMLSIRKCLLKLLRSCMLLSDLFILSLRYDIMALLGAYSLL